MTIEMKYLEKIFFLFETNVNYRKWTTNPKEAVNL